MTDLQQENRLVSAAQHGDQDAFASLLHLYEKQVFALTLRMCKNPEDAAEAAQEAFLSAWQGLPFFRGDSSFSTWLYRLASNACVDLLRRENRHQANAALSLDDDAAKIDPVCGDPSPQALAEQAELREQINSGLQQLPPESREILILREMQQLSYEEISEVLEIDLGTVKSRISRARQKLRKILLASGNFSSPASSKPTETEGCK